MSVEIHDYAGELIVPSNPAPEDTSDEVAIGSNKRREDQAEILDGRESVLKRFRKNSVEKDALGAGRGKRRLAGKLSFLPNMALDILYEIFSHLTPGDLVNVSRVSKAFREVLLAKSSISVWKTSFNNVPGLPPCPEDVCPPIWANLVFGSAICHSCGEKHVRKVNFHLRRRVCPDCQKKHLLTETQFRQFVPSVPDDLMQCIPNVLSYFRGISGLQSAWWDDDVAALEGEVQRLYRCVKPTDLEVALEAFKKNKEASMRRIEAAAATWDTWVQVSTDQRSRVREGKREIWRAEALNRCLALGYEEADCRQILKRKLVNNDSQFSEKAWEKILPRIHLLLEERKAIRLNSERTGRKNARLQVIREEYGGLLKIMLPGPVGRACLPFQSEIAKFPELQSHAEQDEEVTRAFRLSVKRVLDRLQTKLWTLSTQRLDAVVSLVPTFSDQPKCASSSQRYTSMTSSPLDLATSVFACTCSLELPQDSHYHGGTPIQLGLNALGHVCPNSVRYPGGEFSETCLPTFSPKGREIVVMILRDLALDEPHTTIADLDQLDPRFVCLSCPIEPVNDRRRRKSENNGSYATFTWRALISHLLYTQTAPPQIDSEPHDPHPRFKVLSNSNAAIVKRSEEVYLRRVRFPSWGCCHCGVSLCGPRGQDWMTIHEIKEHVKNAHRIDAPLPHRDYFHDPSRYVDSVAYVALSL